MQASFETTFDDITEFFRDQKPTAKTGKKAIPDELKRSPYRGKEVPKAIGRVWIVRGGKEKVFASLEGANTFAASIIAKLREEMLLENIHNIEAHEIPQPTSKNWHEVLDTISDRFGYCRANYLHVIEMGVFE